MTTSVGGGGSGNQGNPGRALRNHHGSILYHLQGRDGPHARSALGMGDTLITGAASVGGGLVLRPRTVDGGLSRPRRKGASNALTILRPG